MYWSRDDFPNVMEQTGSVGDIRGGLAGEFRQFPADSCRPDGVG